MPFHSSRDRAADFMVSHDTTDIRVKWRVRQCRRARTMLGGLRKFLSLAEPDTVLLQQLLNEWAVITRAKGYGTSFTEWVLSWDFVQRFPIDLPSEEWLRDLVQLLQFDCEALASQCARIRAQQFKHAVQRDIENDFSRAGFRGLKPPARPPFTTVSSNISQVAAVITPMDSGEVICTVPTPSLFRPGSSVW